METAHAWTHPAYEKVAELVEAKTGLVFYPRRCADVEAGIRKTMALMKINEVERYLPRLETEKTCLDDLAAELTVGETYFFREPDQFQWIRETILPEILQRRGRKHPLRAWSAACSSGEEAYSLAILFEEEGLANHAPILATDISQAALLKARRAVYTSWSYRGLEGGRIDRYFRRGLNGFVLEPRFQQRVEFERHNLALDPYPDPSPSLGGMDLILCRNVMIYFSPLAVETVFRKLMASLAPGGWLISGPSDPLFEESFDGKKVATPAGVVYQKNARINRQAPGSSWKTETSFVRPFSAGEGMGFVLPETPRPGPSDPPLPPPTAETPLSKAQEAFARMDYGKVLELTQPYLKDAAACLLSIRALANLQDAPAAEQAAANAVRLHPLFPDLHFLRAVLLMNMGKDREAVRDFRRTLYLDPTLAVAQFALGLVLRRLGDLEGARRSYKNTMKLCREFSPESPLRLLEGGGGIGGAIRENIPNPAFSAGWF